MDGGTVTQDGETHGGSGLCTLLRSEGPRLRGRQGNGGRPHGDKCVQTQVRCKNLGQAHRAHLCGEPLGARRVRGRYRRTRRCGAAEALQRLPWRLPRVRPVNGCHARLARRGTLARGCLPALRVLWPATWRLGAVESQGRAHSRGDAPGSGSELLCRLVRGHEGSSSGRLPGHQEPGEGHERANSWGR